MKGKETSFASLLTDLGIDGQPAEAQRSKESREIPVPEDKKQISVRASRGNRRRVARISGSDLPLPKKNAQVALRDFQGNRTRLSGTGRNLADALVKDVAWETGRKPDREENSK